MEDVTIMYRETEPTEINMEMVLDAIRKAFEAFMERVRDIINNAYTLMHEFAHALARIITIHAGKRRRARKQRVQLYWLILNPPVSERTYSETYFSRIPMSSLHTIMTCRLKVCNDSEDANSGYLWEAAVCF